MNPGTYSAVAILADLEAITGELAEHHADDCTAHVFGWITRQAENGTHAPGYLCRGGA